MISGTFGGTDHLTSAIDGLTNLCPIESLSRTVSEVPRVQTRIRTLVREVTVTFERT